MNDYKQRLAHYNDTEWQAMREYCMKDVEATSSYMRTVQRDARFFNRLTLLSWYLPLLVLVTVALWLTVLPGLAAGAILGGLLILAVNNVEEALDDYKTEN